MDAKEISKHFHILTDQQKSRFISNFKNLLDQGEGAMLLRGPYRFVLDSNIIMRLEELEGGKYSEGVLAIMLFFDFYKNQSAFHSDLIITPVVFYEFYKLRNVGSLKEYWEKFKSIRTLVENALSVDVQFENLGSHEEAEYYISSIEHDSELIKARLKSIKEDDLHDLIMLPGGKIEEWIKNGSMKLEPILAANYIYEDLDTTYFDTYYVSLFLKDHIAYKLFTNPGKYIKTDENFEYDYLLRKVVFIDNKERVIGLADIELLSKCNVRHQFDYQSQGTYFPASIPLTIDNNLFLSLKKLSGGQIASEEIIVGENPDDIKTKLASSFEDANRRMGRAEEQLLKYSSASNDYLKSISNLFQDN